MLKAIGNISFLFE